MEEAHVFVCYGPLSLDAARRISGQYRGRNCFLFSQSPGRTQAGEFEREFWLERRLQSCSEWEKPFVVARWFRRALREFRVLGYERIVAYAPHPMELPGNHFLFSEKSVIRRELLPDGLINFVPTPAIPSERRARLRYELRVGLKSLAARIVGLNYRRLATGHLTQYETLAYERTWTDHSSKCLSRAGEVVPLPEPSTSGVRPEYSQTQVLVLDQELRPLVSEGLEGELRTSLLKEVQALGVTRLYYKGHPRGKNRAHVFESIGLQVEDVTSEGIAEEVIEDRQISHLVGFYSTPLLVSPGCVRERICVLPPPHRAGVKNPSQLSDYLSAFESSGATIQLLPS